MARDELPLKTANSTGCGPSFQHYALELTNPLLPDGNPDCPPQSRRWQDQRDSVVIGRSLDARQPLFVLSSSALLQLSPFDRQLNRDSHKRQVRAKRDSNGQIGGSGSWDRLRAANSGFAKRGVSVA
jgi:hypothetical protein